MNNKGFTLIEMIMVIAILAMLAVLTTPNVIKMINKNKADNYNSVIDSIVSSCDLYVSDNRYELRFNNTCSGDYEATPNVSTSITLKDLVNSKDISTPIRNECTNEELNYDTIKITITLDCKTKNFSYKIEDTTNKHFIRKNDVTSNDGKIIEGKYCSDLY